MTSLTTLLNHKHFQCQSLQNRFRAVNDEIEALHKAHETLEQTISSHSATLARVLPEQEMARLNYLMTQRHQQDKLQLDLRAHHEELSIIEAELKQVQQNIKMLEQHLSEQQQDIKKQAEKQHLDHLDDWARLEKESA